MLVYLFPYYYPVTKLFFSYWKKYFSDWNN